MTERYIVEFDKFKDCAYIVDTESEDSFVWEHVEYDGVAEVVCSAMNHAYEVGVEVGLTHVSRVW